MDHLHEYPIKNNSFELITPLVSGYPTYRRWEWSLGDEADIRRVDISWDIYAMLNGGRVNESITKVVPKYGKGYLC